MDLDMDDLELWLPADLLTDDDIVNDFKTDGFTIGSDLSLPPVAAEANGDKDGAIAELRTELARSTMDDSDSSSTEGWKPPDSPQSTLCGYKSDVKGTENSIARDNSSSFYSTAVFQPPPQPNSFIATAQPDQYQIQLQARIAYYQKLQADHKKQQKMRRNGGRIRPQGLQQPGSGMRAVFLGEPGARMERKGTGVFMPRIMHSDLTETFKKPGCSAVFIPERVIDTLNLKVDSVDGHVQNLPITNGSFISNYGGKGLAEQELVLNQE